MESSPPVKFGLPKAHEELNPVVEKAIGEDEIIARLFGDPAWEALKARIQRRMKSLEDTTRVTQDSVEAIDDMAIFGFKCMAKDLLMEAYQGVIDDVDATAIILKEKENESGKDSKR